MVLVGEGWGEGDFNGRPRPFSFDFPQGERAGLCITLPLVPSHQGRGK